MSLRFRLNLLITVLSLLFMAAVGTVIINSMRSSIGESVEAATRVSVQLLDTVIVSSFQNPEWGYTHLVLRDFLQSLGHVRNTDIKLYDIQGELLYQSPPSKFKTTEKPPKWFTELLEPKQELVTRRVRFGTLVVTSSPGGAIREAWGRVRNLLWLGIGFFLLLNISVYWMVGRWLRPLQGVLSAINKVEQGDYTTRLPNSSLPEFSRIAQNFNQMSKSLQESTEENRRLALISKQTADAIMIHDLNGNISFWNPAAQRMFGYAPEEIIGKSSSLLTVPGREVEVEQELSAIASKHNIEHYDTQRITRDGRLVDVSLSAAPLIDPKNESVIGEICSMRDITEKKHAEEAELKLEENRKLTQLIQKHIEDERRSLARELHDELGQYVTAIKTFAVGIANKTAEKMPDIEANAQVIVAAANHIYDGMHNIIRQLRPGSLDNLGLSETLRDSVSDWQSQHPEVRFALNLSGKFDSLGETLNINLYRIVQESVTNALRHANASEIDISLGKKRNGDLKLTIRDNGAGMNICNVDQTKHFGLLGMRERTQALHGTFEVDSRPSEGTTINIVIPKSQLA
ncbi:MAG TPA: PAS domain S-box protein [Methylophilaceae bacterium]|nr:PAS domain S-box protein [Methylophilaceae bacterium]